MFSELSDSYEKTSLNENVFEYKRLIEGWFLDRAGCSNFVYKKRKGLSVAKFYNEVVNSINKRKRMIVLLCMLTTPEEGFFKKEFDKLSEGYTLLLNDYEKESTQIAIVNDIKKIIQDYSDCIIKKDFSSFFVDLSLCEKQIKLEEADVQKEAIVDKCEQPKDTREIKVPNKNPIKDIPPLKKEEPIITKQQATIPASKDESDYNAFCNVCKKRFHLEVTDEEELCSCGSPECSYLSLAKEFLYYGKREAEWLKFEQRLRTEKNIHSKKLERIELYGDLVLHYINEQNKLSFAVLKPNDLIEISECKEDKSISLEEFMEDLSYTNKLEIWYQIVNEVCKINKSSLFVPVLPKTVTINVDKYYSSEPTSDVLKQRWSVSLLKKICTKSFRNGLDSNEVQVAFLKKTAQIIGLFEKPDEAEKNA